MNLHEMMLMQLHENVYMTYPCHSEARVQHSALGERERKGRKCWSNTSCTAGKTLKEVGTAMIFVKFVVNDIMIAYQINHNERVFYSKSFNAEFNDPSGSLHEDNHNV